MGRQITMRPVGDSLGATLPKEIAERLRLAARLETVADLAKRHRHALRELAT